MNRLDRSAVGPEFDSFQHLASKCDRPSLVQIKPEYQPIADSFATTSEFATSHFAPSVTFETPPK